MSRDKTKNRMYNRAHNKRVQSAIETARAEERALNARMEAEESKALELDKARLLADSVLDEVLGETLAMAELKENIRRRAMWPLSDARHLIRVGYSLESTMTRTGWPEEMLADVQPGQW